MNAALRTASTLVLLAAGSTVSAQTWELSIPASTSTPSSGLAANGDLLVAWYENRAQYARLGAEAETLERRELVSGETLSVLAIAEDSLGRTVVAGALASAPWLAAIDRNGNVAWSHIATSSAGKFDSLHVLSNGDLLACGTIRQGFLSTEAIATRVTAQGTPIWSRVYERTGFGNTISDAAETPDGGILLAGHYSNPFGHPQWMVTRLAPQGFTTWQATYVVGDDTSLHDPGICLAPGGDFFLVGVYVARVSTNRAIAIVRCNSIGAVEWSRYYQSYPSADGSSLEIAGVAARPTGGVAVLAVQPTQTQLGEEELALLLIDDDRSIAGFRNHGQSGSHETPGGLHATAGGGFALVGAENGSRLHALRVDSAGQTNCPRPDIYTWGYPLVLTRNSIHDGYRNLSPALVQHSFSTAVRTLSPTLSCANICHVTPTNYGSGTAGTAGFVPRIRATDGYCINDTPVVTVDRGLGGASGALLIGFAATQLPLFGGHLLVDPAGLLAMPIGLDGAAGAGGAGSFGFRLPGDLTPLTGQPFFAQAVVFDPAAEATIAFSDALQFAVF